MGITAIIVGGFLVYTCLDAWLRRRMSPPRIKTLCPDADMYVIGGDGSDVRQLVEHGGYRVIGIDGDDVAMTRDK